MPPSTVRFPVAGMTCQACSQQVEKALSGLPGVASAEASYAAGSASITVEGQPPARADLASALAPHGFRVPEGPAGSAQDEFAFSEESAAAEQRALGRETLVAALFTIPILLSGPLGLPHWSLPLLATLPALAAGRRILRQGFASARHGTPDMNTLVALGSMVALTASYLGLISPETFGMPHASAHAASMILSFVLFGRWLEARARRSTGDALRGLFDLTPPQARVLVRGREENVALAEVRVGQLVLVRPGERIPIDGEVFDGSSEVEESALTGESAPRDIAPGDRVRAGTQNGLGSLSVRAEAIGAQSALGRISSAVREAQASRAPIQKLSDRVAGIFVPTVLVIALLTAAGWLAFGGAGFPAGLQDAIRHAVAVLVVACPCALGLATPTAIAVASGRGAKEGILVRDAGSFERFAAVDSIAFDKTGTLTSGLPELRSIQRANDALGEETLLGLVLGIEAHSEQPLARGICRSIEARGIPPRAVTDFRALPGRGVSARRAPDGASLRLISPRVAREELSQTSTLEPLLEPIESAGESAVVFTVDGEIACILGLHDAPRPSAAKAIRDLREQGCSIAILSGDRTAAARRLARELQIAEDEVHAELLPEEKAAILRSWKADDRRVAMVGDGINDAPALAAADASIAMGSGADIALNASDCALLKSDPDRVPILLRLCRRTLRIIRANLFWAFGYNLVALPLAAGLLERSHGLVLDPATAALAMSLSSVAVVLNSLRLRFVRLG